MSVAVKKLILVPALISLGVTILRLVGELKHWSPTLFNPEAGGGGALVGISWLVPLFGIYFAVRLAKSGSGPAAAGKVIGLAVLAAVAATGIAVGVGFLSGQNFYGQVVSGVVFGVVGIAIVYKSWPELFRTLVAYAFAARIPVAILMFFAIMGEWGTHYDAPPPVELPEMGWLVKWVWIGLFPQLTAWIGYTVVIGMLFGGIAALFVKPKPAA